MKRINCYEFALFTVLVAAAAPAGLTLAQPGETPKPNSAVITTRIFDNCPFSTLVTANSYPLAISISDDAEDGCLGFANLHNWRFSQDGTTKMEILNGNTFRIGADLVIGGPGEGEAGLMISPWFSPQIDGRFNVRTTDGEIAVFGGVLPFYSFTASQGLTYVKGTPIHLEINYDPRSNTEQDPGQIEYKIEYRGVPYTSGLLLMSGCNMMEEPMYGCYGVLNFARAGGHLQALWQAGQGQLIRADWSNITFFSDLKPPTSVKTTSWRRIKSMYR